ncbi:MAG TPA: Smr/MutS family protein, partial [Polyangiaceae bacterium]|nr:Smr/MutS family protein [Polyangiaceae bacterium]
MTPSGIDRSELFSRSREALDYPELLGVLARGCASAPGSAAVLALSPAPEFEEAELRMQRLASALELDRNGAELPRASFADIAEVLERAERGAHVSGAELFDVYRVLEHAQRLRLFMQPHKSDHPLLAGFLASEAHLDVLAARLADSLEPSGEVSDAASRTLADAREGVREAERELRVLLKRLVSANAALLSGEYFAEREGRYVLPVRADAHQRVEGSVIGSSASGNTLFVEPREVAALVNRLRVRQAAVEREVARVLRELVLALVPKVGAVRQAFEASVQADVLGALVRWAARAGASAFAIERAPRLSLIMARHPLLADSPVVVANDLVLGGGEALVLSGPNAGGKTVALKTIGLFALMSAAGIPLPCDPASRVGFFERVLADVGDQQSLSHSLSTFSGHVQKLAAILDVSASGTLVVLDEVAAGTDPEEGAALAGAVLEQLVAKGAAVAVTTHYERLKEQAAGGGPLKNASVGFDFARMQPTFRVTLGAFGPSSALLVAARHGLGPELIARARELLPREAVEREEVVRELEGERHRLAQVERELAEERTRLELWARQLEAEKARLVSEGKRELGRETEKLLSDVRAARSELQHARARVKSEGKTARGLREVEREVSRVAAQVAVGGPLAAAAVARTPAGEALEPTAIVPGQTVRLRSNGAMATVLEAPKNGEVALRIGAIRLRVPVTDLAPVDKKAGAARAARMPKRPLPAPGVPDRVRRTGDNTLDLRGTRVEDAAALLDAFVDRLLSSGEDAGFVLHGHGTGALRQAVREHLLGSTWVGHVEPADKDEGGDAFTMFKI